MGQNKCVVFIVSSDFALTIISEMLWTALLISFPILALSMLVGLVISVFQVVTQVQEMSLTFVPKIVIVAFSLIIFGPWMLKTLIQYARTLLENIPAYF